MLSPKKMSLVFAVAITIVSTLCAPAISFAALTEGAKESVCQGINLSDSSVTCDANAESKVQSTVVKALNLFSAIVGIIAVVMIMVGGIKYTTSQGDTSQVNSAKNTIIYAAVGIVVTMLAQIVVRFVIARFN